MDFRYTPRFRFYLTWYALVIVFVATAFILQMQLLKLVGIDPSGTELVSDFWFQNVFLYFFLTLGIAVIIIIAGFVIPMMVCMRVFDKRGKISFFGSYALLEYEGKYLEICYCDIEAVKKKIHRPGSLYSSRSPIVDYRIKLINQNIMLTSSEKEMRKSLPGTVYSLESAINVLIRKAEFKENKEDSSMFFSKKNKKEDFIDCKQGVPAQTSVFEFTMNSSELGNSFEGVEAYGGKIILAVDMTFKNITSKRLEIYYSDFTVAYGHDDADQSFANGEDLRPLSLAPYEEKSCKIFFMIPQDHYGDYILAYIDHPDSVDSTMYALPF